MIIIKAPYLQNRQQLLNYEYITSGYAMIGMIEEHMSICRLELKHKLAILDRAFIIINSMDDKEIVEKLQNGNEDGIKYLYQHLKMVESWILKNNGSKEDALDLFQEAIIIFYKNVISGKYKLGSRISTYLLAICKNQWRSQLRKNQKYHTTHEVPEHIGEEDELDIKLSKEEWELPTKEAYLTEVIEQLGEKCKAILESAIFLKLDMSVIAQRYGYASAHSARQQKLRCLTKLRSMVSYEYIMSLD